MTLSSFLPQDTRAIELTSAFALILTSIFFLLGANVSPWMLAVHPKEFWVIVLGAFGVVQLIGIVRDSFGAEVVRTIVSWVAGMFWVWLSLEDVLMVVRASEFAAMALGLSNFYAFVINLSLLLREKWR